MEKPTINHWFELKRILKTELDHNNFQGTKLINQIKQSALDGDPEWLNDILIEVGFVEEGDKFFIPGIHDTLKPYKLDINQIYLDFLHYYVEPNTK